MGVGVDVGSEDNDVDRNRGVGRREKKRERGCVCYR